MHDSKLLTVFSASKYCGTNNNYGAFIVFHSGKKYVPEFRKYQATASSEHTEEQTQEKCQEKALRKLREMIFQRRHDLLVVFSAFDSHKDGRITTEVFGT